MLITMATDDAAVKNSTQLGLRDLLMGWDEMARCHFSAAVAADPDCALAWGGLMMTEGATAEVRDALERTLAEDVPATPQETALVSTWLRLARGEYHGAGEEFAERASRYRQDVLSTCWAIRLLHDGYEEVGEKPLANQKRALEYAQALYERKPQDAMVAFMRAWVEESAPVPSETALQAACFAAERLPEHPAAQLLYGHLLYRKGQLDEAIKYVHEAASWAGEARKNVPHGTISTETKSSQSLEYWPLEIRAKLYESTLLWLKGSLKESLVLQAELLKAANAVAEPFTQSPGAAMLLYEVHSLPLRLLMLNPKLPSDAQVKAATKAAQCSYKVEKGHPMEELRDCLRFCVVARQLAAKGRREQALRCIKSAEGCTQRLNQALFDQQWNAHTLSSLTRAHEACHLALLAARAAAYEKTSDIWLESLEKSRRRATLLMPPVLPCRK